MTCYDGSGKVVDCGTWLANATSPTNPSKQIGSQFWLNSGYPGPEPPVAVKSAFSTATYASAWAGQYAQNLMNAGVPVSPAIQNVAQYPNNSPGSTALWAAYPGTAPPGGLPGSNAPALTPASYPSMTPGAGPTAPGTSGPTAGSGNVDTSTSNPGGTGASIASGLGSIDLSSLTQYIPYVLVALVGIFALKELGHSKKIGY